VAGSGDAPHDGSPFVILSRFDHISPGGLRDAETALPSDGRVLVGEVEDVAAALVVHGMRDAGWIGLFALLSTLGATVHLFLAI
jgi:hypothetical protein